MTTTRRLLDVRFLCGLTYAVRFADGLVGEVDLRGFIDGTAGGWPRVTLTPAQRSALATAIAHGAVDADGNLAWPDVGAPIPVAVLHERALRARVVAEIAHPEHPTSTKNLGGPTEAWMNGIRIGSAPDNTVVLDDPEVPAHAVELVPRGHHRARRRWDASARVWHEERIRAGDDFVELVGRWTVRVL